MAITRRLSVLDEAKLLEPPQGSSTVLRKSSCCFSKRRMG
jgi:hypothetical protein